MKKTTFLTTAQVTLCLSQPSFATLIPTYHVTNSDATWTESDPVNDPGVYTVATSAEDYDNEIWERPVQDNEWTDSAGTRTTSKLYYGYADLKSASWGVGNSEGAGTTDTDDYLFMRWEVVGAFQQEPGKAKEDKLLEAHYYFYFEPSGKSALAIEINLPKDLGSNFGDTAGKVFIYDDTNDDVPGTSITTTGEGGDSFGNSQPIGEGRNNTTTFVTEAAVKLSDLGLTLADFNNPLDYAYAGSAVSNPSDPGTG